MKLGIPLGHELEQLLSVLSVEPYGMKLWWPHRIHLRQDPFSALGRAVWDETTSAHARHHHRLRLSVLSVEPYGMKLTAMLRLRPRQCSFSALGRAVWDETPEALSHSLLPPLFQCSRSSRMG